MRVVILGAGLLGVASAYYLARDGHQVVVLDRQPEPARETSYANAGLLTPNHSFTWAGPGAPWLLLKSLWQKDAGLKFRPHMNGQLLDWGLRFLHHCTSRRHVANSLAKARLCFYSMAETEKVGRETGIDWHRGRDGVLYLFPDSHELKEAAKTAELLRDAGTDIGPISFEQVLEIEPALAHARKKFAGALLGRSDEVGDARKFTQELARICRGMGVEFRHNVTIERIDVSGDKVSGISTGNGQVEGDAFILAAGPHSPRLAKSAGLHLPIYPIKGYSLTLPILDPERAPRTGGLDEGTLVAFSRLGDKVRMTTAADVVGYDTGYTPADFVKIISTARDLFPNALAFDRAEHWACLRPSTPDGPPIIGHTPLRNLWTNTGHGYLGWTMCCGSAKLLTDLMSGKQPELDPTPYRYGRY